MKTELDNKFETKDDADFKNEVVLMFLSAAAIGASIALVVLFIIFELILR